MGIHELTLFVRNIPAVWRSRHLSNTKLVIDGNNLLFHLYSSSILDTQCGGQYLEYYQLTRIFFSTLNKNRIEAVVVLDGVDEDDLKLPTQKQRARDKIWRVQRSDPIPPLFIEQVFCQAAADSHVEIKMCDYEGDLVAAQLANSLRCPVLSNDSDFYLLDIPSGVIPIDMFKWQESKGPIECLYYNQDDFLRHIKLSYLFLPLLAVLVGNDITNKEQLSPLHRYMTREVTGTTSYRSDSSYGPIPTVIAWLSKYRCVEKAKADLIEHLQWGHEKFSVILQKSTGKYLCFPNSNEKIADRSGFPDWVIESFKKVRFPRTAVQAVCCRRIMMHVQMEDMKKPSTNTCSRPIRQTLYAIIFRGTAYNQPKVTEIGRADGAVALKDYEIDIPDLPNVCSLTEIQSMSCKERLDVLLSAVGCDFDEFQKVDSNLMLLAAALYYWSHLKTHRVSNKAVYAVIFSFISCNLEFNQIVEQKQEDHCLSMPHLRTKKKDKHWNLELAHHFAEFQSILYYTMMLNSVLDFPLPDVNVAGIFNGRLAHRVSSKYHTYEDFLHASENSKLFADICQLLDRQHDDSDSSRGTKKKMKKRKKSITSTRDLGSRFTYLGLEDDVELDIGPTASDHDGSTNAEKEAKKDKASGKNSDQADDPKCEECEEWASVEKRGVKNHQPAGK